VSVVQFFSSVSALMAVGGAAGLSGDTHLGSVMVLTWPGLIKWQAAVPVAAIGVGPAGLLSGA